MLERRRAVALTRHYREQEGLSVNEIARRLGRTPATVRAYIYDPDGSKARRVKDRYRGVCGCCGAKTTGEGRGRSRPLCARCNGRDTAKWDKGLVEAALRAWVAKHGAPATSTDLSLSYATARAARSDGGCVCDAYRPAGSTDAGQLRALCNTTSGPSKRPTAPHSKPQRARRRTVQRSVEGAVRCERRCKRFRGLRRSGRGLLGMPAASLLLHLAFLLKAG